MGASRHGPLKLITAGIVIGAGLVFAAAAGMRFSDSRPFCGAACHIMNEAAVTQSRSPHASLACNECHAPHNLLHKLPFKAKEGLRDFIENVKGTPVPFRASLETRDVVIANCRACHGVTNESVMAAKPYCVDCHRGVAHQKKLPVSFREAADE